MESIPYLKCVCGNCREVIEYLPSAAKIITCPKCKEPSELPDDTPHPARGEVTPKRLLPCAVCNSHINPITLTCDACEKLRKRNLIIRFSIPAVIVLLVGGWLIYSKIEQPPPPHNSMVILTQPELHLPKSLADLKPGMFSLERKQGGDPAIITGNIQNISDNIHTGLKADIDLLDMYGAKIGTTNDFITVLPAHSTWHFIATVTDTRVLSARFADFKEAQ